MQTLFLRVGLVPRTLVMSARPLRLPPGADLRAALEAATTEHRGSAFVVCGIGSLTDAKLRFAGQEATTTVVGPSEIVSLSGSLSADGAHLHMSVAGADGAVVGGHVVPGNLVRTTVEVLLVPLPEWHLSREHDPSTGYKELLVRSRRTERDA